MRPATRSSKASTLAAPGAPGPRPPAPRVDIGFGSRGAGKVHRDIAGDVRQRPGERVARPLAPEIDRVRDLRVAEPGAGAAAGLDAEMDALRRVDLHHAAEHAEATREIDVLLPAIQRQPLVEPDVVLSHRREPDRHVAAVGGEGGPEPARGPAAGSQHLARVLHPQAGAADAIGEHQTRGDDDAYVRLHVTFDGGQIVWRGHEIVVEEHEQVGVRRGVRDRVALSRQTGRTDQDARAGNEVEVDRAGRANDEPVGRPALAGELAEGFAQHGFTSAGGEADDDAKRHGSPPLLRSLHHTRRHLARNIIHA